MKKLFIGSPDRKAFNCIFWALMLVLFNQTFHTRLSNPVNIFISIIILGLIVYGSYLYSSKHNIPSLIRSFAFLIVYFLVVGLSYLGPFTNNLIGGILTEDLRFVLLFFTGGLFAVNGNMKYFHEIMKILAFISIIFAIPALLFFDFSMAVIEERSGAWSMSYFYWWCSCSCFCYWGYYALFEKKDRLLGFGTLAVYVILGALFLKRSAVVNLFVIIIFYALFEKNKIKNIIYLAISISFVIGVLLVVKGSLVHNLYDLMLSRFDVDVDELDRNIEANMYFQEASPLNLLFGNGIGHLFHSRYARGIEMDINALHLGWANLIYKGGVLYVLYYLVLYFKIFRNIIKQSHKSNFDKVCYGVAISSLVSMFYEGSWTYTLLPFCISAPIYYAALYPITKTPNLPHNT